MDPICSITNNRLKERQQLNKLENVMSQNIDTFLRQKTIIDKSCAGMTKTRIRSLNYFK
jgi:hypothetical protein